MSLVGVLGLNLLLVDGLVFFQSTFHLVILLEAASFLVFAAANTTDGDNQSSDTETNGNGFSVFFSRFCILMVFFLIESVIVVCNICLHSVFIGCLYRSELRSLCSWCGVFGCHLLILGFL